MTFSVQNPALARALTERNYTTLTAVQQAVSEGDFAGRDLLVSAQTGSGKTVAFGIAAAKTLLGMDEKFGRADAPLALVVAPTRELALQVERELEWLFAYTDAKITACVGGMDPKRERRALEMGAHIVVGTPGRLRDHIERKSLDLSDLEVAVLDEADEMLDLGFREDLEFILEAAPEDRQTLLFSATMPKPIVALAKRYQRDAERIETVSQKTGHADIEYRAVRINGRDTKNALVNILRFYDSPASIIFCSTRDAVRQTQATLFERGFSVVALSGELSQNERNHALQALRDGRAKVCVATDVAARGIDLPNLDLVIHADLPNNAEVMQHRSGRTGRAGRKGISVLLAPPSRARRVEQMCHTARVIPQWGPAPSVQDIRAKDQERLLNDPLWSELPSNEERAMAKALLDQQGAENLAASFVRLYRSKLPEAVEVVDPGEGKKPAKGEKSEKGERRSRDFNNSSDTAPRRPREEMGGVWFRLNIGRKGNAEPRWLIPMLCRRGNISKQDIGSIKIADRETTFEIAPELADEFMSNVRRMPHADGTIEFYNGQTSAAPRRSEKPARNGKSFAPRQAANEDKAPKKKKYANSKKKEKAAA